MIFGLVRMWYSVTRSFIHPWNFVLLITTLHHTTSAVVGEVTTATIPKKHSSNNLSVHHFVLASMRHNNLPFLEVSYLWNFRHHLVGYYWYIFASGAFHGRSIPVKVWQLIRTLYCIGFCWVCFPNWVKQSKDDHACTNAPACPSLNLIGGVLSHVHSDSVRC